MSGYRRRRVSTKVIEVKEKDMGVRRRERGGSLGNIEEMLKRKRENVEERGEEGEKRAELGKMMKR